MTHEQELDQPESGAKGGLAAVGVAALMVGCCGAAPFLVVLAGSLTAAAVAGIAAGVLVLGALAGAVILLRRRRACEAPTPSLGQSGIEGVSR